MKINKNVNKLELSEQETNENFCFNFQSEIGLKLQILSKECFFFKKWIMSLSKLKLLVFTFQLQLEENIFQRSQMS